MVEKLTKLIHISEAKTILYYHCEVCAVVNFANIKVLSVDDFRIVFLAKRRRWHAVSISSITDVSR